MKKVKIAIIMHPLNSEIFYKDFSVFYKPYSFFLNRIIKSLSFYNIKKLCLKIPVHKFLEISDIKVSQERRLSIIGIMCPMFPDQMVYDKSLAFKKILEAVKLAQKNNAKIVTLAAFTSIVTDGGKSLLGKADIKITSGNALTAALSIQGVLKSIKLFKNKIEDMEMTIVGATGDIGSICARFFSNKVRILNLCSRNVSEKDELVINLRRDSNIIVNIYNDSKNAVKNADVIITATSAFGGLLNENDFKSGATVCDVSMPPNIQMSEIRRKDLFIFEGGKAKLNFYEEINNPKWKALFGLNSVFGCVAESIVLGLSEKFVDYSIGKGNITEKMLDQIMILAEESGITLSEYKYRDKIYSNDDLSLFIKTYDL